MIHFFETPQRCATAAINSYLLIWVAITGTQSAQAGFLLAPGLRTGVMSFQDTDGEPTPNYYGFGGALSVGYSAGQKFDMTLFGHYAPGRQRRPVFNQEDASLFAYGAEVAGRFGERVYFGIRGGKASYNLLTPPRDYEINGKWTGPAFGFSIGPLFTQGRNSETSWQATLDVLHAIVSPVDDIANEYGGSKRRITCFSASLTWVLNKQASNVIENQLFKGFLDSAIFRW